MTVARVQAAILAAAETVNYWRNGAIAVLAFVVVGCLWVAFGVLGGDGA